MFGNHDFGASEFKTWSKAQRKAEIGKLVEGYRNGVPIGIVLKMAETIAGSQKMAKKHLCTFMTLAEREKAVENESASMRILAAEYLL